MTAYVTGNLGNLAPVYLSSAFTSAATSGAQTVTGLSLSLPVGTFQITGYFPWLPAGTTGSTHTTAATFSGAATGIVSGVSNCSSGASSSASATLTTAITSATHVSGGGLSIITWWAIVTVTGTFQITVTNTTSADTVQLLVGSNLNADRIA